MTTLPHQVRDAVNFSSLSTSLKEPAFSVISALQDHPADQQILATFLAGTMMAQSVGLDPHEIVTRSVRIIDTVEGLNNAHFDAIRDYASGELK